MATASTQDPPKGKTQAAGWNIPVVPVRTPPPSPASPTAARDQATIAAFTEALRVASARHLIVRPAPRPAVRSIIAPVRPFFVVEDPLTAETWEVCFTGRGLLCTCGEEPGCMSTTQEWCEHRGAVWQSVVGADTPYRG